MQVAMESVASVQSVKDWNMRIVTDNFSVAYERTPKDYLPFWMHPDI